MRSNARYNEIENQLAALRATSITGLAPTSFVIDPTAASGANVYTTLAAAVAVAASFAGPKIYEFRGAQTVAAGAYTLAGLNAADPVYFCGGGGGAPIVTLADGVTFPGLRYLQTENMAIRQAGSAPVVTITSGFFVFTGRGGGGFSNSTGAAPFLSCSAGILIVDFCDVSGTQNGAGPIFAITGAGAFLFITMLDETDLGPNTVSQTAGTLSVAFVSSASQTSFTQAGVLAGGLVVGTNASALSRAGLELGPGSGFPGFQSFRIAALAATGISAFIPATITAASCIHPSLRTSAGAGAATTTLYAALSADRVIGLSSAGGGFKITALATAGGAANANDTSAIDVIVVN